MCSICAAADAGVFSFLLLPPITTHTHTHKHAQHIQAISINVAPLKYFIHTTHHAYHCVAAFQLQLIHIYIRVSLCMCAMHVYRVFVRT